ncbi:hypothetical protein [Aurantimicrobium photophilum]|uniref:Uncharacterized protein n=1 Tax=Aurantimicrobium photophilum TaxID=1987356 RepID=A0A2Z3S2H4_9MICO|nr:hypothetical protein [Aurantimicrobium photophilum]AWR20702.1 hypothetical protein AURMO_00077 [Aurantimicrobium photophilum]
MTSHAHPTKRDNLTIVPTHEGYLVTLPGSELVTWINRTAYMVLVLSNGHNSPRGISQTVQALFDLHHDPFPEIQKALQELHKSGLLVEFQAIPVSQKSLLISVRAPGESVSVETLKNITTMTKVLELAEVKHRLVIDPQPDFALSRNRALSAMLLRDEFSHLLLLDGNTYSTRAVTEVSLDHIMSSQHDFVTIPVKQEEPNWNKASASSGLSPEQLSGFAYTYNVIFEGVERPRIQSNGYFEALHTSMSAVVLSRGGIEKLSASNHVTRYRGLVGDQRIEYLEHYWGFFDSVITSHRVASGDVAFCERWRAAGGHIMATTAGSFGHSLSGARALLAQGSK